MSVLSIEQLLHNPDVAPFWRAVQDLRFTVQCCVDCGAARFYPRAICPICGSLAAEWRDDAGTGTVYSVTTIFRAVYTDGPPPPYQVAIGELDVGITFIARMARSATAEVGDRVRIAFESGELDLIIPVFELMQGKGAGNG